MRTGVHGYTYIIDTKYEKDGEMRSGYAISKGYDITQTKGRPLEERPQRDIHTLLEAVLKNQNIRLQIADNLPDKIQAQYIPNQRTIYIRNGMSEITTFHAINRELACAAPVSYTHLGCSKLHGIQKAACSWRRMENGSRRSGSHDGVCMQ